MIAKTYAGNTPEEVKIFLSKVINEGFDPTLAIVFSSIKQDIRALTEIFDEAGIDVFGATKLEGKT